MSNSTDKMPLTGKPNLTGKFACLLHLLFPYDLYCEPARHTHRFSFSVISFTIGESISAPAQGRRPPVLACFRRGALGSQGSPPRLKGGARAPRRAVAGAPGGGSGRGGAEGAGWGAPGAAPGAPGFSPCRAPPTLPGPGSPPPTPRGLRGRGAGCTRGPGRPGLERGESLTSGRWRLNTGCPRVARPLWAGMERAGSREGARAGEVHGRGGGWDPAGGGGLGLARLPRPSGLTGAGP